MIFISQFLRWNRYLKMNSDIIYKPLLFKQKNEEWIIYNEYKF